MPPHSAQDLAELGRNVRVALKKGADPIVLEPVLKAHDLYLSFAHAPDRAWVKQSRNSLEALRGD